MPARTRGILLALLVSASLAAPGRAATCSSSVFVEAAQYPVGRDPVAIVLGDFNGDTHLDVATADQNDGTVSVLLNDGTGAFGPAIASPVENAPYSLAAADLDGDGALDLVVGVYSGVRVMLGNGDGTFAAAVPYPAGNGGVYTVLAASLDAGGTVDLVLSSEYSSFIYVLLGAGDGSFGAGTPFPAGGQTRDLALGDFDGDGAEDVVAANGQNSTVSLLLGFGNGTFAAPSSFIAGSSPSRILAADLDDDGDLDVAVSTAGYVSVLKGNGSGSFGAALQYPIAYPGPIVAGDFTEDGNVDIAVLRYSDYYNSSANRVSIMEGNGTGAFLPPGPAFHSGFGGSDLAPGDLDGDGRADLAVANIGLETVGVLLSSGGGNFVAARSVDVPVPSQTLAGGDYNDDGIPDLALGGYSSVAVMLGDGVGAFHTSDFLNVDSEVAAVIAADFTGDSILDIVALGRYYQFRLLKGLGDGTFEAQPWVSTNSYPNRAAAGDFNGDQKLDLAITFGCCSDGGLAIYPGNGDGTFGAPAMISSPNVLFAVLARDLDGDGHVDLAATSPEGSAAWVFLGHGDGTFEPAAAYPTQSGPRSIDAGDLTGDGILDLVTANHDSQNLSVLPGLGDGTFGPGAVVAVGRPATFAALGDYDGDGILDVASANGEQSSVSLFLGYGGGKLASPVTYETDREPDFLSIADFDLNGSLDLAVATPGDISVTMLLNSRLGVAPLPASGACLGGAGTLHAFAAGYGPLAYQWRKDGAPLSDGGNVSGATAATLVIDPAGAGDEGSYDVAVTDLCTTVVSNATPFAVEAPPGQPDIAIDSPPAPGVAGTASVPAIGGHTYLWTIGGDAGAFIASGQGTSQITFLAQIPGDVTLDVTDYSAPGCGTAAASLGVPVDFFDVPPGHPFHADIVRIARDGITAGCGGGNYCPADLVTRAQMSVFLLKGKNGAGWLPEDRPDYFVDVPPGSFASEWINYIAWLGVTSGCGNGIYCPGAPVTRAQMAVFILKMLGEYYPPYGPQIFDDVPNSAFAANFIDEIYNRGITGGCSVFPKLYCPEGLVTRGQMAVFLVRAFLEPVP